MAGEDANVTATPTPAPQPEPAATPADPSIPYQPVLPPTPVDNSALAHPAVQSAAAQEQVAKGSFGSRLLHGVLGALGGTQESVLTGYDQKTGAPIMSTMQKGPGQQWKQIISGALTGVAGASQVRGPGSPMRGFGAGFEAERAQQELQEQKQKTQAQQSFQNQQEAARSSANIALLGQQLIESRFRLERSQIQADRDDILALNTYNEAIASGGPGTKEVGHFDNVQDAMNAVKDNPTLHDEHAQAHMFYATDIVDGKKKGIKAAIVTPDWQNSKNDKPIDLPVIGGPPQHVEPYTMTNQALQTYMTLYAKTKADMDLKAERERLTGVKADLEKQIDNSRIAANMAGASANQARATYYNAKSKDLPGQLPSGPLPAFDPSYPDPRYFPAGTTGIVPKQIGKVPAIVTTKAGLAANVLDNTNAAYAVIRQRPDLFTDTKGFVERMTDWAGSSDAQLRDLSTYIENIARASAGIHGLKGQYSMEAGVNNLFKGVKENDPAGIIAALHANAQSSTTFLRDEKNFMYYGSRTGPDRKLANPRLAQGGGAPPQPAAGQAAPAAPPAAPAAAPPAAGQAAGGGATTRFNLPNAPATQLPAQALQQVQQANGQPVTFGNGQVWQLQNGQPIRVK